MKKNFARIAVLGRLLVPAFDEYFCYDRLVVVVRVFGLSNGFVWLAFVVLLANHDFSGLPHYTRGLYGFYCCVHDVLPATSIAPGLAFLEF